MGVEVFADELSLIEYGVKEEDRVEGVKAAGESEIAVIIKSCDTTMIF